MTTTKNSRATNRPPSPSQRKKTPVTIWTQGFDEEKKAAFLQYLAGDTVICPRLLEIIDQLIKQTHRQERSQATYDSPSWACKQAHINGYLQMAYQLKDLLTSNE